jgi:DNA-binding IclR family transcriptional regulator
MTRSSPGVRRIVSILNFFADHPSESFTLSDLVRALKLSRATCHGLLTGLVEAGYLYRTSDRGYLLGPALVSVGEVAKAHYSPLKAAQPEMRLLADEFDTVCSAAFREGKDVVIRERASAVSHLGSSLPRGSRLPLLPQFAGNFFVWASTADVKAWLDELDQPPSDSQREALDRGIAFVRKYGFLCAERNLGEGIDQHSSQWLYENAYANAPLLPIFEINPDARYKLAWLNAPVFNTDRSVAFVMGVQGFSGEYTGKKILSIGERVREACDRITSFICRAPPRTLVPDPVAVD